ncbi:putative ribonuclease H-like domain-containing protein, partial [Tanacetum coccineum]
TVDLFIKDREYEVFIGKIPFVNHPKTFKLAFYRPDWWSMMDELAIRPAHIKRIYRQAQFVADMLRGLGFGFILLQGHSLVDRGVRFEVCLDDVLRWDLCKVHRMKVPKVIFVFCVIGSACSLIHATDWIQAWDKLVWTGVDDVFLLAPVLKHVVPSLLRFRIVGQPSSVYHDPFAHQNHVVDHVCALLDENGDSWVSVPQTTQENGTSVTKMSIPVTAKEKTNKKNDVKARSLQLMELPNEHQLTFSQYPDAKIMFAAIETRFGGNAATKKTQKTLLKQWYENFGASSAESLDSIFNMLQKIVSRLAILGVVIAQEDLNSKFLSSLPPEWNTHIVVWMNKPKVETISIDDLYNNFKIVEQKVKKYVGASSGAQNLAFMTALSTSSTNDANTASPQVSTASLNVNTASTQISTASFSDNVVYAFMVENPNGSNLLHQDLETRKKIFINANDTTGYDKSKVECFNYHKMGHFARECKAPRSKEGQFRNQDNTRKQGNNEDTSSKAILAIDGVGFDWSDMAEEQVQTNMALMAFSNSELNQTEFTVATYKRGLATVEEQLITYRKNEVWKWISEKRTKKEAKNDKTEHGIEKHGQAKVNPNKVKCQSQSRNRRNVKWTHPYPSNGLGQPI